MPGIESASALGIRPDRLIKLRRNIINTKLKRSLLIGGTLISIGAVTAGGLGIASAATSNTGRDALVDKLVAKFNLNKADVQKVFDEEHAARETEHEADIKTKLDQAVKDGKLTQDQEDKLIAKLKELQADRDAARDSGTKPDAATMKAKRDEFKKWLSDNNIPEEYGLALGGRGHHGMQSMHKEGMHSTDNDD